MRRTASAVVSSAAVLGSSVSLPTSSGQVAQAASFHQNGRGGQRREGGGFVQRHSAFTQRTEGDFAAEGRSSNSSRTATDPHHERRQRQQSTREPHWQQGGSLRHSSIREEGGRRGQEESRFKQRREDEGHASRSREDSSERRRGVDRATAEPSSAPRGPQSASTSSASAPAAPRARLPNSRKQQQNQQQQQQRKHDDQRAKNDGGAAFNMGAYRASNLASAVGTSNAAADIGAASSAAMASFGSGDFSSSGPSIALRPGGGGGISAMMSSSSKQHQQQRRVGEGYAEDGGASTRPHGTPDRRRSNAAARQNNSDNQQQPPPPIRTTRTERWVAALRAYNAAAPADRTPALAFATLEAFRQPILACEFGEHKALREAMRHKYGVRAAEEERVVGDAAMRARAATHFAMGLQQSAAAAAAGGSDASSTAAVDVAGGGTAARSGRRTASEDEEAGGVANEAAAFLDSDGGPSSPTASQIPPSRIGTALGGGARDSANGQYADKSFEDDDGDILPASAANPSNSQRRRAEAVVGDLERRVGGGSSRSATNDDDEALSRTADKLSLAEATDTSTPQQKSQKKQPSVTASRALKAQEATSAAQYGDWDDCDEAVEHSPQTAILLDAFAEFRLAAASEGGGLTPFEASELYQKAISMLVESEDKAMTRTNLRSTGDRSNTPQNNNNSNGARYDRNHTDNTVNTKDRQRAFVGDFSIDSAGSDAESHKALVRRQKLPPTSFVLQAIACLAEAKLLRVPLTAGHYLPILKCPLVAEIDKDLPMRLLSDAAAAVADTLADAGREAPAEAARRAVFRAQVAAAGTYAVTGNWQHALLLCRTDPALAALAKSLVESGQWPWAFHLVSQVAAANKQQYLRSVSIAEAHSATAKAAVEYGMRVAFSNANPIAAKVGTSNRVASARVNGVTEGFSALGGPVGETRDRLLKAAGSATLTTPPYSYGGGGGGGGAKGGNSNSSETEEADFALGDERAPKGTRGAHTVSSGGDIALAEPVDPAAIRLYLDFSDPAACAYAVVSSTRYAENQVAPYNCRAPQEVEALYDSWLGLVKEWLEANAHHKQQQNHNTRDGNQGAGAEEDEERGLFSVDEWRSSAAEADEGGDVDQEATAATKKVYLHTPKHLTRQVLEPLILAAPPGRALDALALFPAFAVHYHRHVEALDAKVAAITAANAAAFGEGQHHQNSSHYHSNNYNNNGSQRHQRAAMRLRELERQRAIAKRGEVVAGEVVPLGVLIRSLHRSCEWRTIVRFYCDTVLGGEKRGEEKKDEGQKASTINADAANAVGASAGGDIKAAPCPVRSALVRRMRSVLAADVDALSHDLVAVLSGGVDKAVGGADGAATVKGSSSSPPMPLARLPLRPNIFNGYEWHPADEAHVLLAIGQAILCGSGDVPDLSQLDRPQQPSKATTTAATDEQTQETARRKDASQSTPTFASTSAAADLNAQLDAHLSSVLGGDREIFLKKSEASAAAASSPSASNADTSKGFTPADAIAFAAILPDTNSHKHMALLHILSRGGRGCPAGTHWEASVAALVRTDAMSNIFIDLVTWQLTAAGYFRKAVEVFEDFMRRRKRRAVQLGSHEQHPRWPIFSFLMLSSAALRSVRAVAPPSSLSGGSVVGSESVDGNDSSGFSASLSLLPASANSGVAAPVDSAAEKRRAAAAHLPLRDFILATAPETLPPHASSSSQLSLLHDADAFSNASSAPSKSPDTDSAASTTTPAASREAAMAALLRLIEIGATRVDAWAVMHAVACLVCAAVEVPVIPAALIAEERAYYERQLALWAQQQQQQQQDLLYVGGEADGGDGAILPNNSSSSVAEQQESSAAAAAEGEEGDVGSEESGGEPFSPLLARALRAGMRSKPSVLAPLRLTTATPYDRNTKNKSQNGRGGGNINSHHGEEQPQQQPPTQRPITYQRVRKFNERQAFLRQEAQSLELELDDIASSSSPQSQSHHMAFKGRAERWSAHSQSQRGGRGASTSAGFSEDSAAASGPSSAAQQCLKSDAVQKLLALLRSSALDGCRPRTQSEFNNLANFFVKQVYAVIKYYAEIDHRCPSEQLTSYAHSHDDLRTRHMGMLRRFPHELPACEAAVAPTVRERVQFRLDGSAAVILAVIKELAQRGPDTRRSGGGGGGGGGASSRPPFSTTAVVTAAVRKGIPLPMESLID